MIHWTLPGSWSVYQTIYVYMDKYIEDGWVDELLVYWFLWELFSRTEIRKFWSKICIMTSSIEVCLTWACFIYDFCILQYVDIRNVRMCLYVWIISKTVPFLSISKKRTSYLECVIIERFIETGCNLVWRLHNITSLSSLVINWAIFSFTCDSSTILLSMPLIISDSFTSGMSRLFSCSWLIVKLNGYTQDSDEHSINANDGWSKCCFIREEHKGHSMAEERIINNKLGSEYLITSSYIVRFFNLR